MKRKIFAAIFGAAILLGGCGSGSADYNEDVPDVSQASPVEKIVPNFTARTIDGATVTKEIFSAKKITVVNIWGTFCPPCIEEMPELAEMARNLLDDAQIVGVVCDAAENSPQIQTAQEIVREAGADFVNIIPDAQLSGFIRGVEAIPTTIFINSKGEVVGKAIIGANVDAYKAELEKLLND